MGDFFKKFRRQRSMKHSLTEASLDQCNETPIKNNEQNESNLPDEAAKRHNSISFESSSNSAMKNTEENDGFKEPKGWRKSLRKLKLKKRAPVSSISYDNIAKIPSNVENSDAVKQTTAESEIAISKRWSYSPDLCEDNVPGARELRGTIERKLSVKLEVDEKNASKYQQINEQHHLPRSRQESFIQAINTGYVSSAKIKELVSTQYETPTNSTSNMKSTMFTFHSPPTDNNDTPSDANFEWNSNEKRDSLQLSSEHDTAYATSISQRSFSSIPPSTSGQSIYSNEYVYNPEISDYMGTSLHGRGDGSWLRERTLTKFEQEAENVLENYASPEYDNDGYKDVIKPYYRTVKTTENEFEDPRVISDDSYDTNEFDSSCDDLDDKEIETKDNKKETKADKVKDVSKRRFWERPSIKKKYSISEPSEEDNFVHLPLSEEDHPPPCLPQSPPPDMTENQLKRRRIVGTILSSEQSYIESLRRVETDYKQALLDSKPPIIGADTVEKIFYKISAILQCHQLFQMALASAARHWDEEERIGDTFVASFAKEMVLECYCDFINNFAAAMETVKKTCVRKQQFVSFLQERQAESSDRLALYSLMLKPVQRFPQFIMLVQDLLKNTPSGHVDRLPLQLALTELESLADKLNRRKALDEDASNLRALAETSNLKLSNHTKDGRLRRLIKQGDVRECELNEDGLLEKVKDCLLILTNDLLICCAISNRKPQQRGVPSTYKDMYKLKWKVDLADVDVMDGPVKKGDDQDREDLHSDFITLHKISQLVDILRCDHDGLSPQIVKQCIHKVETKIRQAEQLASHPSDASFTVTFPDKSDTTSRTLVLQYHSAKEKWLADIAKAKLANAPSNIDSWFAPDMVDEELGWDSPLFLRSVFVHMSPSQTRFNTNSSSLQVQCAHSFMTSNNLTLLWLSCAASTVLAVISVYYVTEERIEKVHVMQVKSSVQCMEHWNPFGNSPSIWLGMESGSLLEYSSDGSYRKLGEVVTPTMSTVMIMKSHLNRLYVGLLDGTLALYTRATETSELHHVSSIVVGGGPLVCLFPEEDQLWACSGNSVATINVNDSRTVSSRSLLLDGEELVVSLVTRVGRGLWVTFSQSCSLNLYHLGSLKRLQEINLSRHVKDFAQSLDRNESISEAFHITSLCAAHSQLFVGTSNGLLMAMPLTKLAESVPKITGPCLISRHALSGSFSFLFAPLLPSRALPDAVDAKQTPSSSLSNQDVAPPPLPRRDDLDKNPSLRRHEKTSSLTESTTPKSYHFRETSLPPDGPPSTPPKPHRYSVPARLSLSAFETPMSSPLLSLGELTPDHVVSNRLNLESVQSPCLDTFVKWNDKSNRQSHLLLACGEGYLRYGAKQESDSSLSPAILCWKVFL